MLADNENSEAQHALNDHDDTDQPEFVATEDVAYVSMSLYTGRSGNGTSTSSMTFDYPDPHPELLASTILRTAIAAATGAGPDVLRAFEQQVGERAEQWRVDPGGSLVVTDRKDMEQMVGSIGQS